MSRFDYISDRERRTIDGVAELREQQDGRRTVVGYAARFNQESELLWDFREVIEPGAFDGVLDDDVRALFNHDPNLVLGRTKAGTLRLSVDERGLRYEIDLPDTQVARDLVESLRRGDVSQSSFSFTVDADGDEWEQRPDGTYLRRIKRIKRLYDVSPVTYPAYSTTEATVRSLDGHRNTERKEDNPKNPQPWRRQLARRRLRIFEIKKSVIK